MRLGFLKKNLIRMPKRHEKTYNISIRHNHIRLYNKCVVWLRSVAHHAKSCGGQILVCVAGRGYYQEEGKEAVEMKPGDCINIPAEVKHWHGAAPDSWFSHLSLYSEGLTPSQSRKQVQNLLSSAKPLAKQISFIVRLVFFKRYLA